MPLSLSRSLFVSCVTVGAFAVLCFSGTPLAAQEGAQDRMNDVLQAVQSEAPPVPLPLPAPDSVAPPQDVGLDPPKVQKISEVTDNKVVPIPTLTEEVNPDENLFFDAESLVPTGEMGRKGGPKKVNPRLEPASKFIVVKKNFGPKSKDAQLVSADRALKLGRYESALEIYETLYAKNKRDPNVLMGRAVALHHLGRTEEALRAYETLLDVKPENIDARVNMLGVLGQRFPAVALRQLMDLREKNSNHVGLVAQIAVVQAQMGQYDDAIRYLGVAASMEPGNATHVFNMAVIADRAGNKKDAVKFYEEALEKDTLSGSGQDIPRDTIFERLAQLR